MIAIGEQNSESDTLYLFQDVLQELALGGALANAITAFRKKTLDRSAKTLTSSNASVFTSFISIVKESNKYFLIRNDLVLRLMIGENSLFGTSKNER